MAWTYPDALAFLDGLTDYERKTGFRYDGKNFNLERTRRLLAATGVPDGGMARVIVAGTKGKGSTAAMLSSILAASGVRTGLFCSPHLRDWTERIRVDGREISREDFTALALRLKDAAGRPGNGEEGVPTTFEVLTVMAALHFAERGAGAAVLEVGMGGRLDSVNSFPADAVCITPVSLDHTDQLGDTIAAIAAEKAGVIKSAAPVVCGEQPPEALEVVRRACAARGATLHLVGKDITARDVQVTREGASFRAVTPWGETETLAIPLAGRHQVGNALAALGAACALRERVKVTNFGVREGLRRVSWPGRLQYLSGKPQVLLDGAHNGASAEALAAYLCEFHAGARIQLVLGMLRGKDHAGFVRVLRTLVADVRLPRLVHPRALAPGELRKAAAPMLDGATVHETAAAAVAAARAAASADGLVLVTGSLSLVGECLKG